MTTVEIALATQSASISLADLRPIAAVLTKQAQQHVLPIWGVGARVTVLEDLQHVPHGVSPIILQDAVPGGMHGVHTMDNGIAFAVVLAAAGWPLAVSHEFVEMIVDPAGTKTVPGRKMQIVDGAAQDTADRVDYILEVCDPVEDQSFGYMIDGVLVSDFYTQHYFDDTADPQKQYSHTGKLTRPRQVGTRGYLSWHDPQSDQLQQMRLFDGLQIVTLPNQPGAATADTPIHLRSFIDRHSETPRIARMRQQPL